MSWYRHVKGPAIHPTSGAPVALGDTVELTADEAASYVRSGILLEQPQPDAPPAPAKPKRTRRRTA